MAAAELEGVVGPELADVALRLAEERRRIHAAGGTTEGLDWVARIEAHLDDLRTRRRRARAEARGAVRAAPKRRRQYGVGG